MNINLHLDKKVFAPYALKYIEDYGARWEMWYGGAGSAKSYSITQKLIVRCLREKIKVLVCRRYGSTLRNTCFSLFKEILSKWKLTTLVAIRETDFSITFPNGSQVIMLGLDEETKLLSLNDIGTVWVEEAYEVPKETVEQLNLRMRSNNENQQIIMSWNPIAKTSWLYDFVNNPPSSSRVIFSTFKDNPFLNKEYISAMEDLRVRNPRKAKIYYYGEWGVDTEGLVYTNWRIEEFDVSAFHLENRVGIDFGFRDPSAIVCSFYDPENKRIYIYDCWYKTNQQLDQIYEAICSMNQTKATVYCDSAEPRSIDFLRKKGINAKPCLKGPDSIDARIAFLQNQEIIVHPDCKDIIRELENYVYLKDRDGNYTSKTEHAFSHSLDALGYAYSNIYAGAKMRTLNKSVLGL